MWRLVLAVIWLPLAAMAQDFFTLKGHGGPIMGIAVSPSGRIATASFDNSVGLWSDARPRWLEGHEAAVKTVIFLGDDRIASAGDDFAIQIWDIETGIAQRLEGHKGQIIDLALSPDGTTLASASWDGSIGLWPLSGEAPRFLDGHDAGVNAVTFDAAGRLYSASTDGTIRLWDLGEGQVIRTLVRHGFGVNRMVLDAQERWLAYGAVDGVTRVIDIATTGPIADLTLERRPILSMAQDPGGTRLAVGDGEGYIMIVDTTTWRISRDFRATARGPVWALAWSADGRNVHAGGLDDAMYSWPVATMDEHGQMTTDERSFLARPETMTNGERQFQRKCSICHTLTEGSARRAGPSLYDLFGRPAGTVADYSYSPTLINSTIIWSDKTIDGLFDLGPDHYIPGSKMPMQRITALQDRTDLINYLREATAPREK